MTWFLEDKSIWAAAMAMSLALIHVNPFIFVHESEKLTQLNSRFVSFLFFAFAKRNDKLLGCECSFGSYSYASIAT